MEHYNMVDVMVPGETGRIHAVYQKGPEDSAPMAVIIPGAPRAGLHMNDRINYALFRAYMDIGFSVIRFDFRGVGDSEGILGNLDDNLRDIASVVDWIQNQNEEADVLWLAGARQGAWYVLQSMMRRPEVRGFTLVSPDHMITNYAFLSPRPNRGLLLQGANECPDALNFAPHLTQLLKRQAKINLETIRVKNSDEKFERTLKQMYDEIKAYVGREKEENRLL
ncbi:MAG: alpha/beta fold hydrolase [Rickettsiales bacterium]|jgi:alpha/beta superfamily hydrolase|nr:alpha/beta fold hydrolase [Rickettsiales bacterium]